MFLSLAVAASIAVVTVALLFNAAPPTAPQRPIVASIERVIGQGLTLATEGSERRVSATDAAGMMLRVGETLRTGAGARIALRYDNGLSLRINEHTEIVVQGQDDVSVTAGVLYLDTGQTDPAPSALQITTPHGAVQHVGTQFEVLVDPQRLRVRVREGEVVFTDSNRELRSRAGEELLILPGGVPSRSSIPPTDGAWAWATELAVVQGDEHALPSLLSWIARESGRTIRFASPGVETRAQTLVINGVAGYSASEALEVLPALTDLAYELDDELILISEAR